MSSIRLSICIATYKRGQFISRTLDSIICQIQPEVEIVVVDGASPDNTEMVMEKYVAICSQISYYREEKNSGVDCDFDKAVQYAQGQYCWLMTDDDLLRPNAIQKVLTAIKKGRDLIIVNAEVKNTDLSETLEDRRLQLFSDSVYGGREQNSFFVETAQYLSFIGCVVIKRSIWLSRDRKSYYGTLFIHVGVIFQTPLLTDTMVISEPLIIIRYGNAMWTPRGFEIWMFKWPSLVWSFSDFTDSEKLKICRAEPWRSAKTLFLYRALGSYTTEQFYQFYPNSAGKIERRVAYGISIFPVKIANFIMVLYFILGKNKSGPSLYDLSHSNQSMAVSRFLVRVTMKLAKARKVN